MHGNRAATLRHGPRAILLACVAGVACAASVACAPTVESPAEAGHRRDLRDAAIIAQQLGHVPLVQAAHVTLTRPTADVLRGEPGAAPASASVVLVHDARAEAAALTRDARALVTAVAPEVTSARIAVVTRPSAPPPVLAAVGPFQVAAGSRSGVMAALVALLAACAGLGITLAVRERSRRLGGSAGALHADAAASSATATSSAAGPASVK